MPLVKNTVKLQYEERYGEWPQDLQMQEKLIRKDTGSVMHIENVTMYQYIKYGYQRGLISDDEYEKVMKMNDTDTLDYIIYFISKYKRDDGDPRIIPMPKKTRSSTPGKKRSSSSTPEEKRPRQRTQSTIRTVFPIEDLFIDRSINAPPDTIQEWREDEVADVFEQDSSIGLSAIMDVARALRGLNRNSFS